MPVINAVLLLIFGSIIGSFLNVVIYRLPKKESIVYGPSHCMECNTRIRTFDLIPIISYLILGGKCRQCRAKISIRYPIIEMVNGLLYVWIFLSKGLDVDSLLLMSFASTLLVVTMIDIDTMDIYDGTLVMILILGIGRLLTNFSSFPSAVISGLIVSVPLYIIAILTQGIGGGDVKLMAVGGFFLGIKATIVGTFIGILLGGVWGIILLSVFKKEGKAMIPFGPFLCIGMFVAAMYGVQLADLYLKVMF